MPQRQIFRLGLFSLLLIAAGRLWGQAIWIAIRCCPDGDRRRSPGCIGAGAGLRRGRKHAAHVEVEVNLVNVFVTVVDSNGNPVAGLQSSDFRLLEDGNLEKIAVFNRESQLPLSIILAVDTSLSTHKDLHLELDSARRFARSVVRPVDALAVYEFSEIVQEVVPFTADLRQIDCGVAGIRAGSATAMYDAVYLGAQALETRRGRKVLVMITDGGDTVSSVDYHEALRAAQEAEAIVYSIIVVPIASSACSDLGGEHALIQLSHDTGG